MRKSDFDVWYNRFQPIEKDSDNILFETYGEDLYFVQNQPNDTIWTLVSEGSKLYMTPGYRLVNRVNYFITKNPHLSGQRDYKY